MLNIEKFGVINRQFVLHWADIIYLGITASFSGSLQYLWIHRRQYQLFEPAGRADVVHQELNPPWTEAAAQGRKNAPLRDYFGGQRPDPGQQLPAAPDGGAWRVLNVVADRRQRRPVSRGSVGKVSLNSLVQPVLDRLGLSGALVVFDVLAVVEELECGVAADLLCLAYFCCLGAVNFCDDNLVGNGGELLKLRGEALAVSAPWGEKFNQGGLACSDMFVKGSGEVLNCLECEYQH
ncbi:hypothetical protein SS50377_20780 [Spironucleus salmonicida]|uniref:Uncharacterized protein n=1 Tax=Spironucleus salmonicida TaxID=348837 RepID=A0A9P8S1U7_9EUKA|nr:hypothetical protein SS50377_20780 [Spironucleus salmonicida]